MNKIVILSALFSIFICVGCVSAEELQTDALTIENYGYSSSDSDVITSNGLEDNGLTNDNAGESKSNNPITNFEELETAISQSNGTLILNSDVTKDSSEFDKYKDGIVINKDITIIGNGFTINANNDGRIFFLNSGFTLTLINITLANAHVSLWGQ